MEFNDLSKHRQEVLSIYEKTDDDMKAGLEILKNWLKKQPHIPMDLMQDGFLEIQLLQNKFLIEKTKSKIENYCTLKGKKYNDIIEGYHEPIPSKEAQFYIPLPVLTENFERIIFGKVWDESLYDFKKDLSGWLMMTEIRSRFDYRCRDILIVDSTCCTMKMFTKLRANLLIDAMTIAQKGYSTRIKEIHIISEFASAMITMGKPILPAKLLGWFIAHDNVDSLKKRIPAKYLPSDYGGEQKSFKEMLRDWDAVVISNKDLISKYINTIAREEFRIRDSTAPEDMQGSFRKLQID